MGQGLGGREPLGGVELQGTVQQVDQLQRRLQLVAAHALRRVAREQPCTQRLDRLAQVPPSHVLLACAPVHLEAQEHVVILKVLRCKLALFQLLGRKPALELLHQQQHLVVGAPWEEDLARGQLVQGAADGPHVDSTVVRLP